jgi:hypothetical protein
LSLGNYFKNKMSLNNPSLLLSDFKFHKLEHKDFEKKNEEEKTHRDGNQWFALKSKASAFFCARSCNYIKIMCVEN